MSSYVPFHDLAVAIHGAPTKEVLQTFKALAEIVIKTHVVTKMKAEMPRDTETIKAGLGHIAREMRTYRRRQFLDRPHLLSKVDAKNTFKLIHQNVEKIVGDPAGVVLYQKEGPVTLAEHWLISCTIHHESGLQDGLRHLWSRYLEGPQPGYQPVLSREVRYGEQVLEARRFAEHGMASYFPGLVHTLRSFISADQFDEDGVFVVLREYLSLGATAACIWMHMWQVHGIRRGLPLDEHDSHLEEAMRRIDMSFTERISDWQNNMPLRVRQKLAPHCFSGDFLFLANHVFSTAIAPAGSDIREYMFGWEMHQFIVNAATAPEVDPDGRIARVIQQRSLNPEPSSGSRLLYLPDSIGTYITFEIFFLDPQDVELEAYGPLIDVYGFTNTGEPSGGSICTICQDGFDGSGEGESPCVQLIGCEHMFHWDCLHTWLNGVHKIEVLCPNCRTPICKARPRRRKEDQAERE